MIATRIAPATSATIHRDVADPSDFNAQQCLYFLPLPQGQASLRPGWDIETIVIDVPRHSARSAVTGRTRVARRAGT